METVFSCLLTSSAYHVWNLLLNSSFMGLLIEMSRGWSLSVQLAGTGTWIMLCFFSAAANSGVVCPRKQSKIARAGCALSSCKVARLSSTNGTITFSTYRNIVSSFDQWLCECQISQPSGTSPAGWQRSVLPLYISWGGKYSPDMVTARTAVIWRLSSLLVMGTTFSPHLCMVHWPVGTKWRAVWSQFNTSSAGISFMTTSACMSARKSPWISRNRGTATFPAFEHFLLTYPIRVRRDLAQAFVIWMWPPCWASRPWSREATIPSAAAMQMLVFTTPPTALMAVT